MKILTLTLIGCIAAFIQLGSAQSLSISHEEVHWARITFADSSPGDDTISPYTIPYANMDAHNPCRRAAGFVWDLRSQIEYYKNHAEVYGNFYELTSDGYVKTKMAPPTDYGIKSFTDTQWGTTNLIPEISWFRLSGWVSKIITTNDSKILLIDTWDATKHRKVGSYCLYHPKASQFTWGDYVDCLVYYSRTNQSETFSYENVDYDVVQYGTPDYGNENSLPKRTNAVAPSVVTSVEVGTATKDTETITVDAETPNLDSTPVVVPSTHTLKGLVAYYPLHGDAHDASGNGNDGVLHNIQLASDRLGNKHGALAFNGINQSQSASMVIIPRPLINLGQNEYTICLWFMPSNTTQITRSLIGNVNTSTGLEIGFNNNNEPNTVEFFIGPGNAFWHSLNNHGPSINFQPHQWYFVSFIKHNLTYFLFINGKLQTRVDVPSAATYNYDIQPLIGAYGLDGSQAFNGNINEVRIYNRSLSLLEVQKLFYASQH